MFWDSRGLGTVRLLTRDEFSRRLGRRFDGRFKFASVDLCRGSKIQAFAFRFDHLGEFLLEPCRNIFIAHLQRIG